MKNNLKSKVGIETEMMSVAVSVDYTGKGIASNLTRILRDNGKKLGYKIFYAECSSNFSKRAIEKHGGKVKHTIPYREYQYKKYRCSKPTYPFAAA